MFKKRKIFPEYWVEKDSWEKIRIGCWLYISNNLVKNLYSPTIFLLDLNSKHH
jgi:hypothetical protein